MTFRLPPRRPRPRDRDIVELFAQDILDDPEMTKAFARYAAAGSTLARQALALVEAGWRQAGATTPTRKDTTTMPSPAKFGSIRPLRVADFVGKPPVRFVIGRVAEEDVGWGGKTDVRLVVYPVSHGRGFKLNRDNVGELLMGGLDRTNTDRWIGAELEVSTKRVEFRGNQVAVFTFKVVALPGAAKQGPGSSQDQARLEVAP